MSVNRKLARFLKPYWLAVLLAPALMTGEVALDLMQPKLMQQIIDRGIAHADFHLVQRTGLLMLAFAALGILTGSGCTVYATIAAQNFGADLRRALFARVQSLSFANLDALETGALITRLTNDVTQVQEVVLILLRIMVRVPLLLVGSLIMAILTSPRLAILFVPLIPFITAVLILVIRRTYPLFGEVQRRLDRLNTVLQENLSGVRVVKAFAREPYEAERFNDANESLVERNVTATRIGSVTLPAMMLALNSGVALVLWMGGVQVIAGALPAGKVIAFVNYLGMTLYSLMMVSMLIVRISRAEASAKRIGELLESEPAIRTAPNALRAFRPKGRVAFENVSFRYTGEDADPVLRDISFTVEPGRTVGILGATGSGKSSLVQLIPRFYDVSAGRITIDGIDVREIEEQALHRAVGVALQEAVLFSGTLRDNIRYGRPEADDEEVVRAAKAAQADEFIRSFPEGYDTIVGQRGVNLSGGQKQRVAIARALLSRPPILILDDSTSAVDVHTEAKIQQALRGDAGGQTRFIVAQRITAVVDADLILVLDDGRLVGRGTHAELIESCPVYREIYASQQEMGAPVYAA